MLHGCMTLLTSAETLLHVRVCMITLEHVDQLAQMQKSYCSTRSLLKAQAGSSWGPNTFTSTPASALTMFVTSNLQVCSTD